MNEPERTNETADNTVISNEMLYDPVNLTAEKRNNVMTARYDEKTEYIVKIQYD